MKNWKTTLIGLLTGAGYLLLQSLSGGMKVRDAVLATGIAVLGAVAKDHNVTGGTTPQ